TRGTTVHRSSPPRCYERNPPRRDERPGAVGQAYSGGTRAGQGESTAERGKLGCLAATRRGARGHQGLSRGTMRVKGYRYACRSVRAPTTMARKMLCQTTALKMSASLP